MPLLKLRRIPGRYHATLTGTTMTVALTGVVSLALTDQECRHRAGRGDALRGVLGDCHRDRRPGTLRAAAVRVEASRPGSRTSAAAALAHVRAPRSVRIIVGMGCPRPAPRYMLADIPEWRRRRERTRDMKFKRLPARYGALLMPLTLSLLMSGVVSFIATLKSVGHGQQHRRPVARRLAGVVSDRLPDAAHGSAPGAEDCRPAGRARGTSAIAPTATRP